MKKSFTGIYLLGETNGESAFGSLSGYLGDTCFSLCINDRAKSNNSPLDSVTEFSLTLEELKGLSVQLERFITKIEESTT